MNKEALKQLGGYTGTEHYYKMPLFPHVVYTDGVQALAQNAECYWLIEEIMGAQRLVEIRNDPMLRDMQFWTLKKDTEGATLVCERDSGNVAWTKKIPATDFPFDTLPNPRIWVAPTAMGNSTAQVLYLPSEH